MTPLETAQLELETERLRLIPFSLADLDIAQALLCDRDVMRYVADPMSPEHVADNMHNYAKRGAGGRIGIWCVTRKDTGQKIGDCVLLPVPIETEEYDWDLLSEHAYPDAYIEVGYLLIPEAWGQGYATEICARLLRFAFEETSLDRVVATTDNENHKSRHVLGKCGFQLKGRRRAYGYDNVDWFEIERGDWRPDAV
ncbi:MAG: GNAT family N-acetyltransferase [Pseudomonadota bacterium]